MAISFGASGSGPKDDDVVALIAARKYARAVEILKAQLQKRGANPSLRMQLADVLILAGKRSEAVALLLPLADQYATDGFAAKAVSVLKKVQKVDPGRSDVQARLARLIEEKQKEAVVLPLTRTGGPAAAGPAASAEEADGGAVLEIGFSMAPISVSAQAPAEAARPAQPVSQPQRAQAPAVQARAGTPRVAEPASSFGVPAAGGRPAAAHRNVPGRRPSPADTLPAVPGGRPPLRADAPPPSTGNELELPDLSADATIAPSSGDLDLGHQALATGPDLALEPLPAGELELEALPELVPLPASRALRTDLDLSPTPADGSRHNLGAGDIGIEDNDLLFAGEEEEEAGVLPVDVDSILARSEPAGELSDGQFADELMSLVDTMFQEAPVASTAAAAPRSSSTQIVVSPLFRDFSVDEMVAVIEGLKLLTVERGEVILREGDPGSSLYTLTSGRVRAFRKDTRGGKQLPLGDLKEGAFFGELSVLTGAPRAATVVALTRCELLELDRPALDEITKTHPHVWNVLREFASQRSGRH